MKTVGTEELAGKPEKKAKTEEKHEKKGGEKKAPHKGLRLAEIRVRPQKGDGTHHIEHHMEDKNGMPHHQVYGYTAANKQDVADHMMEHLPEGAGDEEAQEPPPQGQQGAGAPAPEEAE
jgi:hypothetical protein